MAKKKKKSKKGKKAKKGKSKPNLGHIDDKSYLINSIGSSITLLSSIEEKIVLDSLIFLIHYIDLHDNNVRSVLSFGILNKLLILLNQNLCILRLIFRLLTMLLNCDNTRQEIGQEIYNDGILKTCALFTTTTDVPLKELLTQVFIVYVKINKPLLLQEPLMLSTVFTLINNPDTEQIYANSLQIFNDFLDMDEVRDHLHEQYKFNLSKITSGTSEEIGFDFCLDILEKITTFANEILQIKLRECKIFETIVNVVIDPGKQQFTEVSLRILYNCMKYDPTSTYFLEELEFLKFCQWAKLCPDHLLLLCEQIFKQLCANAKIRQILFDLSVEEVLLHHMNSSNLDILDVICFSLLQLSKHKYCRQKLTSQFVLCKLLEILQVGGNPENPITLLHFLSFKDEKSLVLLNSCGALSVLWDFLSQLKPLDDSLFRKVFDIFQMFVKSRDLRQFLLSPEFYEIIMRQTLSRLNDISLKCLEILIYYLTESEFRKFFLTWNFPHVLKEILKRSDEALVNSALRFTYYVLSYEDLVCNLIERDILNILEDIPTGVKYQNPEVEWSIQVIYKLWPAAKFLRCNRLEPSDKTGDFFYLIKEPWSGHVPKLEALDRLTNSCNLTVYVSSTCDLSLQQYIISCKILETVAPIRQKVQALSHFIASTFTSDNFDNLHDFCFHLATIKEKFHSSVIPIGCLKQGLQSERALLFKILADSINFPVSLVRNHFGSFYNEVTIIEKNEDYSGISTFVVDLLNYVGALYPLGSPDCNKYCNIKDKKMERQVNEFYKENQLQYNEAWRRYINIDINKLHCGSNK